MAGGVILTIPKAKKYPSANLTSRAYPLNSVKFSFDWQAPAFPRWVFPMYFPASDPIFPVTELDFDLSEGCSDFPDGRGGWPSKGKEVPNGVKV